MEELIMGVYDELKARGLIAQLTNEEKVRDLLNNGKTSFYIGFDPTADSLHVGHFVQIMVILSILPGFSSRVRTKRGIICS